MSSLKSVISKNLALLILSSISFISTVALGQELVRVNLEDVVPVKAGHYIEDEIASQLGSCSVYGRKFQKNKWDIEDILSNGNVPDNQAITYIPSSILRPAYRELNMMVFPLPSTSTRSLFFNLFRTQPQTWESISRISSDPSYILNTSIGQSPESALYTDTTTIIYHASCLSAADSLTNLGINLGLSEVKSSIKTAFEESTELLLMYGTFFSPIHYALNNAPNSREETEVYWALWKSYIQTNRREPFFYIKSMKGWAVASTSVRHMAVTSSIAGTANASTGIASIQEAANGGQIGNRSLAITSYSLLPIVSQFPIADSLPSIQRIHEWISSNLTKQYITISRSDRSTQRISILTNKISEWGCSSGFSLGNFEIQLNDGTSTRSENSSLALLPTSPTSWNNNACTIRIDISQQDIPIDNVRAIKLNIVSNQSIDNLLLKLPLVIYIER